jgi:hypothetical protein
MKKLLIYITCLVVLSLTSCDLDINDNPNYASSDDISTDLIFPSVQSAIVAANNDVMFNYAGFFAQYFDQMPEANQFNDLAELSISESDETIDDAYFDIYASALQDIEDIKDATTNAADYFAAIILRAYCFQLMVDNMDYCPYSDALNGTVEPTWDEGQTVYEGVLAEMDAAEADYNASSDDMTMTDMMFDQDMDQWVGYANALRLRMYLRLYEVDNSVADDIITLVNENNFFTGDVELDIYSNADGNRSPFYASYYSLGTGNHVAAYPLVSYMNYTNDPRREYAMYTAASSDEYVGQLCGTKTIMDSWAGDWDNDDVSNINYDLYDGSGVDRPAYIFTQSELQFFIAEVELLFNGDDVAAQIAYETAIAEDFSTKGFSEDYTSFISQSSISWDNATTNDEKMKLIGMQKWIALFYMDNMEAWSEIRRTDIPETSESSAYTVYNDPTSYTAGDLVLNYLSSLDDDESLMKRMYYPEQARSLNSNTPEISSTYYGSDPVWWDVNY